jgi:hypothetical protein
MNDAKLWLERLRIETEELRLISRLATDPAKRATFTRLADQHQEMADDLQATIDANRFAPDPRPRRAVD